MKGQYLAVETVFTFGIGLVVAIGVTALFHDYRTGVMDGVRADQAEVVSSQVISALEALEQSDTSAAAGRGRYQLDLPRRLAGESYDVFMGDELVISTGDESYSRNLSYYRDYDFEGSASGGEVTIFKDQNNIELRSR